MSGRSIKKPIVETIMNRYAKPLLSGALFLLSIAAPASAHEVWLERDGTGPARIYLRELAETVEESDETPRLRQSVVFTGDPSRPAPLVHKDRHFEAAVTGKGDVRLRNDNVFAPWMDGGIKQGQVYHARAGRSETAAKLDFEFVPAKAGGNEFTLLFRGKPVADTEVTVFSPGRTKQIAKTNAAGRIAVPDKDRGRYILVASTSEDITRRMGGEDVARVHHMTTLSYVND